MKFLHISDLHIGKRINEFPMIEDQKYILRQILEIAGDGGVQGILIAGDIYDKQSPSAEAVQVFDWFLTALADLGKEVFVVSGNHDSPERLSFGARLMRERAVYVSRAYDGNALRVELKDEYGAVYVHLLPFIRPAFLRYVLEKESEHKGEVKAPETYQEAVRMAVERMEIDPLARNILVAHQFVTGAGRCESEEVAVGGIDNVDAEVFAPFDYVALGHIHSPQWVGRESVRYCGTPLKYSFSEWEQQKSVTILELKEKGNLSVTVLPLKPLHDMRRIRGTYMEVTSPSFYNKEERERKICAGSGQEGACPEKEDYVQITLTDEEDIIDAFMKLRIIYPNLMRLNYDNSRTRRDQGTQAAEDVEQKSELALLGEFYELQNNQPMSGQQIEFAKKLIESCRGDNQEEK